LPGRRAEQSRMDRVEKSKTEQSRAVQRRTKQKLVRPDSSKAGQRRAAQSSNESGNLGRKRWQEGA
jgi:hypothetical protein